MVTGRATAARQKSWRLASQSSCPPQLGILCLIAQLPSSRHRMHGVGLWLNPAYGSKCKGIEPTLARCVRAVRERGCWLVALLPLYSFKTW